MGPGNRPLFITKQVTLKKPEISKSASPWETGGHADL